MNIKKVKESLRTLILNNESTLIGSIEHQGQLRRIAQVALTNLTPPQGYYYILVYISDAVEMTQTSGQTTARPKRMVDYTVQIEISDEAMVQYSDQMTQAYESMALDFDLFTDRLVNLLENRNWLDAGNSLKLKRGTGPSDRRIEKSVFSDPSFRTTEGDAVALLYAQLRFNVVEECTDTEALYD